MKGIEVLKALNDIDDTYIEEASVVEKKPSYMPFILYRLVPLAAVLCLGVFFTLKSFNKPEMAYEAAPAEAVEEGVEEEMMITGFTMSDKEESMMTSAVTYQALVKIVEESDEGYLVEIMMDDHFKEGSLVEIITDEKLVGEIEVVYSDFDEELGKIYVLEVNIK